MLVTLDQVPFDLIMDCFRKAFANYFVKMPTEAAYYRQRFEVARVRYDRSYGILKDQQLVAFVIHAIDHRQGDRVAFNTGTGVHPSFQRKGLVQQIYEHAIPQLKSSGINKLRLEVIQKNLPAIKAYEKIGFSIVRDLHCFQGKISTSAPPFDRVALAFKEIDWTQIPHQQYQSWDHHQNCLVRGPYLFYQLMHQGSPAGFFALNPNQHYLAQAETFNGSDHHWDRAFASVRELSAEVKINNVDARQQQKLDAIKRAEIKATVNQYEMEMDL